MNQREFNIVTGGLQNNKENMLWVEKTRESNDGGGIFFTPNQPSSGDEV